MPKPDKISLIAPLRYDHFIPKPKDDKQFEGYIKGLAESLSKHDGLTQPSGAYFSKKASGVFAQVGLRAGDRQSTVLVQIMRPKKGAKPTPWKLRIEFNPRKLGPVGSWAAIHELNWNKTFRIARFLAEARLTRLDVAVDVVGVSVGETLPRDPRTGKTTYFIGEDGNLETIFLFRKTASKKASGRAIAKIYDRVKERASVSKPPPLGGAPVTRVEVVKTWTSKAPGLSSLFELTDQLKDLSVGYVGVQPPGTNESWAAYVACRRTNDAKASARLLGLKVAQQLTFAKAFKTTESHLLPPTEVWKWWAHGLEQTGLGFWIEVAKAGPSDIFEGGQI